MQFTASEEYVELLGQARDVVAHAVPNRALNEIHLRALRLLVAELKKRKYALTDKPRPAAPREDAGYTPNGPDATPVISDAQPELASVAGELPMNTDPLAPSIAAACGLDEVVAGRECAKNRGRGTSSEHWPGKNSGNPPQRGFGRYVPAAVRRAVAERDQERCAYVDDDGRRCRETSSLELHHLEPHARGGRPTEANLALRCRAHNDLAAENDFGREFMAKKKTQNSANVPSMK